MKTLKKCVGVLCCAGVLGCTGAAQSVRPLPPPEDCPAGAQEAMYKYGLDFVPVSYKDESLVDRSTVRWRMGVRGSDLDLGYAEGRLFIGGGRIYGRFVRATKGKLSVPICMAVYDCNTKELGLPADTSETPAKIIEGIGEDDHSAMCLRPVTRLP